MITYINRLNYERFENDRDNYLQNVNVVNFDIINHELLGTPLEKDIIMYKTVYKSDLRQMPANDKDAARAACFRSKRKDLNVEKELRDKYFKEWYSTSSSNSTRSRSSNSNSKDKEALKRKNQKYFNCW